jgi:hypothetical protein
MSSTPRWIPILFGSVMIFMATIILGALIGIVPADGVFLAPPIIIAGIVIGLFFGGIALWIPSKTPSIIKSGIFLIALFSLATVCNWTAFAPEVTYTSSTSIGLLQISGDDQIGGRVVFGAAAIVIDLILLSVVIGWIRPSRRKGK